MSAPERPVRDEFEVVLMARNLRTGQTVRQTYWRASAPILHGEPRYRDNSGYWLRGPDEVEQWDMSLSFSTVPDPAHGGDAGLYESDVE